MPASPSRRRPTDAPGLTLGRAERFDVIILDVMLPGLDGVTVCRALRTEGESRDTPILMFADSLASELVTPAGDPSSGYTASCQVGIAA